MGACALSKAEIKEPSCGFLKMLPSNLLDNVWTFIPFEYLVKRCLSRWFLNRACSFGLRISIWYEVQTCVLSTFNSVDVQTVFDFNVNDKIKKMDNINSCVQYFSARVGAAFIMQYQCTVRDCIQKHTHNESLFRLCLLAMTYFWEFPESLDVPAWSRKQHFDFVTLLHSKRARFFILSFEPQNLCSDVLSKWIRHIRCSQLEINNCHLNSEHLQLVLNIIHPRGMQNIEVANNNLDDHCVDSIVDFLKKNSHMRMSLENNTFSANGKAEILQAAHGKAWGAHLLVKVY